MSMPARDWRQWMGQIAEDLKRQTGDDVEAWNARIREAGLGDEGSLRAWLDERGVRGYQQMLLVMERFGYPAHLLATADELVAGQYADRPALRPILDALLVAAGPLGEVTVQARKTYVALLTPRRTFAAVQATTRRQVDLGLRLADPPLGSRLEPARSMGSSAVTARIRLASVEEIDDEVMRWLRRAYDENV